MTPATVKVITARYERLLLAAKNPLTTRAGEGRFLRNPPKGLSGADAQAVALLRALIYASASRPHYFEIGTGGARQIDTLWALHSKGMPLAETLRRGSNFVRRATGTDGLKAYISFQAPASSWIKDYEQRHENQPTAKEVADILEWYTSPELRSWLNEEVYRILQEQGIADRVHKPKAEEIMPEPTALTHEETLAERMAEEVAAWRASRMKADAYLAHNFPAVHRRFCDTWAAGSENPYVLRMMKLTIKVLGRDVSGSFTSYDRVPVGRGSKDDERYILCTYAICQALLQRKRIRTLPLFRGVNTGQAADLRDKFRGRVLNAQQRPLSSWTSDVKVAREFSRYQGPGGLVQKAVFPASRIFSFYEMFTASDAATVDHEKEYIVLGGRYSTTIVR